MKTIESIDTTTKPEVLIYSGGLDSTVLLHQNRETIGAAIFYTFDSKANFVEHLAAQKFCKELEIPLFEFSLHNLFRYSSSSQFTRSESVPQEEKTESALKKTVIPFRNGILLSCAINFAEEFGFSTVLYAAHRSDTPNYPDCSTDFLRGFQIASVYGTHSKIKVKAPYIQLLKNQIVNIGIKAGVKFEETFSCYEPVSIHHKAFHCGKCPSCLERKAVLGEEDKTIYANNLKLDVNSNLNTEDQK